ncbi:MAG: long-chain-fatty-acid--CoA ligase [Myxococcales bacterium]|nr:long-chain-fatty-acid--CoA ligase [Myxococcales bacterium]
MHGLMMTRPLLISGILRFAERAHGNREIVSRRAEDLAIHRYTYRELGVRARKLAKALLALGIKPGDRVATIAWNGYRHLELYYAVSGIGAVLHTINPRLHPTQIAWIMNHAEDKALFVDTTFAKLLAGVAPHVASLAHKVVLCGREHMPAETPDATCYEELVAAQADDAFEWPEFDENTASCLCYTSGTTGNPRGVLYSHRSTVLHAYASSLPDVMGIRAVDAILPVVPMFHVNAWGLPYSALINGAKIVFPGPALDGKSVYELMESERVTFSAGVPTVWLGLLAHVEQNKLRFTTLKRCVIGGSAAPVALQQRFEREYGVEILHAWGMTEMSPLGTLNQPTSEHERESEEAKYTRKAKQGRGVYGVELRIVDEAGKELPWDGTSFGALHVRGPWIAGSYFRSESGAFTADGWFDTGDVATIDAQGFMKITDRTKDVIKSGGEWIGSLDLEDVIMKHPSVAMAAAIAVPHEKWGERPLLVVVKKPGQELSRDEAIGYFEGKVAKWWIPSDVVFVDALPLGATGKVLKTELRQKFASHAWPEGV